MYFHGKVIYLHQVISYVYLYDPVDELVGNGIRVMLNFVLLLY